MKNSVFLGQTGWSIFYIAKIVPLDAGSRLLKARFRLGETEQKRPGFIKTECDKYYRNILYMPRSYPE